MVYRKDRNIKGSITVYLTVVFLVLLSLILVTLESARIAAVKCTMQLQASNSMDSILAQFYYPLYEEYKLFGRVADCETKQDLIRDIEFELEESFQYTSNPLYGLEEVQGNLHTLLQTDIEEVKVSRTSFFHEVYTEAFYSQAVEAMQLQGVESFIHTMLEKAKMLSESQSAVTAYGMQADITEELVKLDETSMRLMVLLDGIAMDEQQVIQVNTDGVPKCTTMFAKKYVKSADSMEDVKVNHLVLYQSLRPFYINKGNVYGDCNRLLQEMVDQLDHISRLEISCISLGEELDQLSNQLNRLQSECSSLEREAKQIQDRLNGLFTNYENNKSRIEELTLQLNDVQWSISDVCKSMEEKRAIQSSINTSIMEQQKKIELLKETYRTYKSNYFFQISSVEDNLIKCKDILESAIEVASDGIERQKLAKNEVITYESKLSELSNKISDEIMSSLQSNLSDIKSYVTLKDNKTSVNYNYTLMKQTLQHDYEILLNKIQYVSSQTIADDSKSIQAIKARIEENQRAMDQYSIDGLEFDYSTLNLSQKKTNSVIDTITQVMEQGLLYYVVEDLDKVSENKLRQSMELPSKIAMLPTDEIGCGDLTGMLKNFDHAAFKDLFDSCSKLFEGNISGFTTDIMEAGFFQTYLNEFFKDYTIEEKPLVQTVLYPSMINYEKEYICFHKESDKENLSSMIWTLFLVRFIFNVISIFSNKEHNEKAQLTATALVAFTGLTILVTITKLLILTMWAVLETIIDIAILLQGKELRLMSIKKQHMKYEELLLINKKVVLDQAKNYSEKEKVSMNYDQYLFLFLLLQSKDNKCLRGMDIIQENLNYRYEEPFLFYRCLYGYEVEIHYAIPYLYTIGMELSKPIQVKRTMKMSY